MATISATFHPPIDNPPCDRQTRSMYRRFQGPTPIKPVQSRGGTGLKRGYASRGWIDSLINGKPDHSLAPQAWSTWRQTGRRKPLVAARTLEYRSRAEQLPTDKDGQAMMEAIRVHFKRRPHAFEHCAAALARLMIPDIAGLDVTRPSRDGGTRPRRFSTARRPTRIRIRTPMSTNRARQRKAAG